MTTLIKNQTTKPRSIFLKLLSVLLPILALSSLTGCDAGSKEVHHVFPQEFRGEFEKIGLDVDDFGLELTKKTHRTGVDALHRLKNGTHWNAEWRSFFTQNKSPTKQQAMGKLETMLSNEGFTGKLGFVRYSGPNKGTPTGQLVVKNPNVFLTFLGNIGQLLERILGNSDGGKELLNLLAALGTFVLGLFGIKVQRPAAIGLGCIVSIIGFLLIAGTFYLIWLANAWLLIPAIAILILSIYIGTLFIG